MRGAGRHPHLGGALAQDDADGVRRYRARLGVPSFIDRPEERPRHHPAQAKPRRQCVTPRRTQVYHPSPPPFARPDGESLARWVDVPPLERHDLGAAETRPVEDGEEPAIPDARRGRVGVTDGEERVELVRPERPPAGEGRPTYGPEIRRPLVALDVHQSQPPCFPEDAAERGEHLVRRDRGVLRGERRPQGGCLGMGEGAPRERPCVRRCALQQGRHRAERAGHGAPGAGGEAPEVAPRRVGRRSLPRTAILDSDRDPFACRRRFVTWSSHARADLSHSPSH